MLLSNPVSATHLSSILRMPSLWKSIPPRLLCSFPPALANRPGRGDYAVPPQIQARQQMVLINWHPPAIQEEEAEKLAEPPRHGCVFLGSVCQSRQFFSHLKPELFTRALGECVRSTGGWEERRRESCCFSTSASNQSPEITAMVYGLWSWLLFRTARERVGVGKWERGAGEKGESQGPEGAEVRGERLGGRGPFALSEHVLI